MLKEVDFTDNITTEHTAEEVKQAKEKAFAVIKDHPELEQIYFCGYGLLPQDIKELSDILEHHKELKILDLGYNKIGAQGLVLLKKVLLNNTQLQELILQYNSITDEGIIDLLSDQAVVARVRNVKIRFECNQITDKGLRKARGILSPASILTVTSGNPIKDKALMEECDNEALEKLDNKDEKNIVVGTVQQTGEAFHSELFPKANEQGAVPPKTSSDVPSALSDTTKNVDLKQKP